MRRRDIILVLETIVIKISERNVKEGLTSHLLLTKGERCYEAKIQYQIDQELK